MKGRLDEKLKFSTMQPLLRARAKKLADLEKNEAEAVSLVAAIKPLRFSSPSVSSANCAISIHLTFSGCGFFSTGRARDSVGPKSALVALAVSSLFLGVYPKVC